MGGRLAGRVALITGIARGQGRSHAIGFAREGAHVIGIDICAEVPSSACPLATPEDLANTVAEVEAVGGRIVVAQGDVRLRSDIDSVISAGLAEFGQLDIVLANAGICPIGSPGVGAFIDAVDIDLGGVFNTVSCAFQHLGAGGSIVVTGSTAGLHPEGTSNPALGPGGAGYAFAKQTIAQYVKHFALVAAPQQIRVNAVHPTNCDTPLLHNRGVYRAFRPDLDQPTFEDVEGSFIDYHAIPVPYVEPQDVTDTMIFLASNESRYITGQNFRIDAGSMLKQPGAMK